MPVLTAGSDVEVIGGDATCGLHTSGHQFGRRATKKPGDRRPRDAVAEGYHRESSVSGARRAPSPMEKALTRREHNFVREQTDDYDHEHDADNLVHGI